MRASQLISGIDKNNPEMIEDTIDLYFQKSELIPAVVQEAGTGDVLMLAYMNRQSLGHFPGKGPDLRSGPVPGRSCGLRGKPAAITSTLWSCGPTATRTPCWCGCARMDACHLGTDSCFDGNPIYESEED